MRQVIILLLCCVSLPLNAQKILLHKNIEDLYKDELKRGQNFTHYRHLYVNYGFILGGSEGAGADIEYGKSNALALGLRYKLRLSNIFAIGYSLQYSLYSYHIKQDSLKKIIPNDNIHQKEKLKFNNLGFEFYTRINFGKRGNLIGKFLDAGMYADWTFRAKHTYTEKVDKFTNQNKGGIEKTSIRDLSYIEEINYGLRSRIGINRYVITASYRLSNLFNNEFHNEEYDFEFPRFFIGLEIGLHK